MTQRQTKAFLIALLSKPIEYILGNDPIQA
jgi:hypothetical protein